MYTFKHGYKCIMKKILVLSTILLIYAFSCIKQTTKQTTTAEGKRPLYHYVQGDTTQYIIGFSKNRELKSFIRKFERLIKVYSIDTIISDTINQYFCLRITTAERDTSKISKHKMAKIDKIDFSESDIEIKKESSIEDTILPTPGGKVTIYTGRKFIDITLSGLIEDVPFSIDTAGNIIPTKDTTLSKFLIINQLSPVKIRIICTDKLIDNSGKHLTAFDIVQAWTRFIKSNPAEGLALFSQVKGIKKFIRGEEGIIQGFSVSNEKTIIITLAKSDSYALQRLNSPKLLPHSLAIGKFYVKKQQDNKLLLQKNNNYPFDQPFLDKCTIICGKDKNPIVSYSLNKYDMIILYKKKDLEYARQSLVKNSHLVPFSIDRYFISLNSKSSELRKYLKTIIIPNEIHTNAVKAEGEIINEIESAHQKIIINKNTSHTKKPTVTDPLTILYNNDDPVSILIAEKIFSDLSHSALPCKLKGLTKSKLEIALIDRGYDIEIGWASNKILTNKNSKLRLATIWFNNDTSEAKRISENFEIPLFTINRYALCKKNINFYKNLLSGIYRDSE